MGAAAAPSTVYQPGSEFSAKRAGGDITRRRQATVGGSKASVVQPYAYIPVGVGKRKQAKFSGQIQHLVAGAKKGLKKGRKGRPAAKNYKGKMVKGQKIIPM